jgi:hypothetical protein
MATAQLPCLVMWLSIYSAGPGCSSIRANPHRNRRIHECAGEIQTWIRRNFIRSGKFRPGFKSHDRQRRTVFQQIGIENRNGRRKADGSNHKTPGKWRFANWQKTGWSHKSQFDKLSAFSKASRTETLHRSRCKNWFLAAKLGKQFGSSELDRWTSFDFEIIQHLSVHLDLRKIVKESGGAIDSRGQPPDVSCPTCSSFDAEPNSGASTLPWQGARREFQVSETFVKKIPHGSLRFDSQNFCICWMW